MKKKINIEEAFNIKSFKSTTSVWVCRDWAGPHICSEKPKRGNNGYKEDEWFVSLDRLDNVWSVKNMSDKFTKGWDINHNPEQITINFEIKF
jgi:hypothetical protein